MSTAVHLAQSSTSLSTPDANNPLPTPVVTPSSIRLYEGALLKRGKVNKSWKERWFVLTMQSRLNYYESHKLSQQTFTVNNDRNILGSIDLLTVERIQVSLIQNMDKKRIPKYIQVLDNDKDDRSYLMHLVTSSRTYKLSANDGDSLLKWLHTLHQHLYQGIKYEGSLEKKGEVNKAFKRRYFVLYDNKLLKYYSNEERETMHGFIDLKDSSIALKVQSSDFTANQDNVIELVSEKRKWVLKLPKDIDADVFREWIAYLQAELTQSTPSKRSVVSMPQPLPDIEKKPGEVHALWMKAQNEMQLGRQPTVIKEAGFRLNKLGKYRKTKTTVDNIQFLLDVRTGRQTQNQQQQQQQQPAQSQSPKQQPQLMETLSFRAAHGYGMDSADYTDNEMSDEQENDDYFDVDSDDDHDSDHEQNSNNTLSPPASPAKRKQHQSYHHNMQHSK
mmetsp:Transcript_41731/g.67118  ORF Transcript_41731/g.67118 Transcript_41731/m.67118 type:complete len:445 (-) Transcript_41731:253-1587(-)